MSEMFKLLGIILIFAFTFVDSYKALSEEFLEDLKTQTKLWNAGRTFHPKYPTKYLLGTLEDPEMSDLEEIKYPEHNYKDIPETFDAREKWPDCVTIREIQDQGSCASDWAVAPVSVISDRHCIVTNASQIVRYSAKEVITCCPLCGFQCKGGYTIATWRYWKYIGITTGGPYNSTSGCQPYHIPPCEHYGAGTTRPNCDNGWHFARCQFKCIPEYKNKTFSQDHNSGIKIYKIQNSTRQIQLEIMRNGPVTAMFKVMEDFVHYKSGVYEYTSGGNLGLHTVKIIGWGIENIKDESVPYWLAANSWNTDWGEQGYFKILKGVNHLKIEANIMGGIPFINDD